MEIERLKPPYFGFVRSASETSSLSTASASSGDAYTLVAFGALSKTLTRTFVPLGKAPDPPSVKGARQFVRNDTGVSSRAS